MTTTTKARKASKEISCTPEAKELFDSLYERAKATGDFTGNKSEYLQYVLEREKERSNQPSPKSESTTSKGLEMDESLVWFTNVSGKSVEEKQTKLTEIKEILGVDEDEKIFFTRLELYQKASKLSGKSLTDIVKDGADAEAQALITAMRNPNATGQGRLGSADVALDSAFKEVIEQIKLGIYTPKKDLPITKISQRAGANFNSAKSWSQRRGFAFPMAIDHAIKLAEKL